MYTYMFSGWPLLSNQEVTFFLSLRHAVLLADLGLQAFNSTAKLLDNYNCNYNCNYNYNHTTLPLQLQIQKQIYHATVHQLHYTRLITLHTL